MWRPKLPDSGDPEFWPVAGIIVAPTILYLVTGGAPIYVKQSGTGLVPANSGDKACGLLMDSASGAGSLVPFMAFDAIMP